MKIYLASNSAEGAPPRRVYVAPAADRDGSNHHEVPAEWWDVDPETGAPKPRQIAVKFEQGVAVVSDSLGRYMTERGLAFKTARG